MESLTGIKWNRWPEWNGISGRDRMESVAGIVWNTQCPRKYNLRPQKILLEL